MADVQVVYLQGLLKVERAEPKLNSSFPALTLTGKRFDTAAAVLINGIEAPGFTVFGTTRIVAEIPASVDVVASIAVLSHTATAAGRSIITLRLTQTYRKVRGIQRLVQRFVLMLLTNPGSDLYAPHRGGGLRKLLGKVVQRSGEGPILAQAQQAVDKAVRDLREIQSRSSAANADERIAGATVLNIEFDPRTTTMAIRIQLNAESGRSAITDLFS